MTSNDSLVPNSPIMGNYDFFMQEPMLGNTSKINGTQNSIIYE